jgi:hypothetical protein
MNIISTIQGRLSAQPFAFNFTEEVRYDASIFIFNELESMAQVMVAEALDKASRAPVHTDEGEELSDPAKDIRRQIESELQEEIEEITEGQEEDIFSKAERLKRIAQQRKAGTSPPPKNRTRISASKKTGVSVSRSS